MSVTSSLEEYVAYCRSGQSTKDQRRRQPRHRTTGMYCDLCGRWCLLAADGLCFRCRQRQNQHDANAGEGR